MDTIAGAFFANSNSCSHGKTRLGEGRVFIRRGEVNYSSESEPEPEPEPESEPESESPSDADSLRRDEVESETELEPESLSDDSFRRDDPGAEVDADECDGEVPGAEVDFDDSGAEVESDADSLRRDEVESETELEPESDPSDDSLR